MRIIPSTRVLGGGALGLACFLGLALLLMGDTRDGDDSPGGGLPTAEEIELAEIDLEIEEAFQTLRSRETTTRERLNEREAFLVLNRELLARRDALAKTVTAAARQEPVARPVRSQRQAVDGETLDERTLRELEDALAAAVDAIRATETDPVARQDRVREYLEAHAEALAAIDTLRARIVVPPAPSNLSAFVPREPAPGETAVESELRSLDNTLASGIHAIRRAETDPDILRARLGDFLATHRPLLERQQVLQKLATRAALDTVVPRRPAPIPPSAE